MRSLSAAAKNAIFSSQTSEVFLVLLTVDHDDLDSPVRVTSDSQQTTSNGNDYTPFPFVISLPAETDAELAKVNLTIDAVDRSLIEIIRSLTSPPSITLEVVLASDPDTVEAGPFDFTMRDVQYDALTITSSLQFEDILNTKWPGDSFTPSLYTALF